MCIVDMCSRKNVPLLVKFPLEIDNQNEIRVLNKNIKKQQQQQQQ